MTERPILFSGEMVRAILEGRKTMTRRVIKPVRGFERNNILKPDMAADPWAVWWHGPETERVGCLQECSYGKPGDRLWVRESFYVACVRSKDYGIGFKADHPTGSLRDGDGGYNFRSFPDDDGTSWNWAQMHSGTHRWMPGIHMPRWASRITLEVTEVRAERLQEISETDARSEGIQVLPLQSADDPSAWWQSSPGVHQDRTARGCFIQLWDSINGNRQNCAWKDNPWVWVVSFGRIEV